MTRAIIFVPSENYDEHAARCLSYCEQQGYEFTGIIRDDWEAAEKMMKDGQTSVVLVSVEAHLNPERKPRIEVLDQIVPYADNEQPASMRDRRTRIMRRNEAR